MSLESEHLTLAASTKSTVTFEGDFEFLEVLNRDGADEVYFTFLPTDPTDPVAEADDTWVLPSAISSRLFAMAGKEAGITVELISPGTPKVSVLAW